jgi:hypothetical protein
MPVPVQPKIYPIVHIDNPASVVGDASFWIGVAFETFARRGG